MKILYEETKKIWSIPIILIIIIAGFMYYDYYLSFYIEHFPNGHDATEEFLIYSSWVEKYGTKMDEEERIDAEVQLKELYEKADEIILSYPLFTGEGIYSFADYKDYENLQNKFQSEDGLEPENYDAVHRLMCFNDEFNLKHDYIYYWIQTLEINFERYDFCVEESYFDLRFIDNVKEAERVKLIIDNGGNQNIMSYELLEVTQSYITNILGFLVLCVCILVSPLLVRDRMTRMRDMIWSSKIGRNIFKKQFFAVMISAFFLITILIILFTIIFSSNNVNVFFPCELYSFNTGKAFWLDFTYGNYIVLLIIMSYVISMGTAGLLFFLSKFSENYVQMLLKGIPVFYILWVIVKMTLLNAFSFNNRLYSKTKLVGIEGMACLLLAIASILLCCFGGWGQRKEEI